MRAHAIVVAVLAAVALAGCSSSDDIPAADPSQAASPADVGWSPCDGLDAATVSRFIGEEMNEDTGTADQPRCTFTPVVEGGPAFDVNYLWFDGGLTEALDSMGTVPGTVTDIDVRGADAARLVVHARRPAILVTGFVQSGGLVQSVNTVQLRPYDERTVVAATRRLLETLVREAPADSSAP
ncbi:MULTISPECIES: DUF3558 domain-containing protein [unclassified Nocardioides]|uniref:DUF3558 domain-containing protein n=1 Tax=unclassified Nocardioides TaxID=2615069 RepID=UPI0009F0BED8|nr:MULTISPECIES: DUF3558 domain-containing protein [unclassified Nocardioides]GAW51942.1 uncharacterized protein (Precursor) [Nocardioides sp. PD653-B2]GAW56452.1 uncharacterized protein (Precursor) [Nocardioides sp. PD653]